MGENRNDNVVGVNNYFQFKWNKNYFIIPQISFADVFEDFKKADFLKINKSSVGLTAGYRSPFGQIKVNYSQPLKDKSKGIFSVILGHWF